MPKPELAAAVLAEEALEALEAPASEVETIVGVAVPAAAAGLIPMSVFNGRDANKDGKLTAQELAGSPMADRFDEVGQRR